MPQTRALALEACLGECVMHESLRASLAASAVKAQNLQSPLAGRPERMSCSGEPVEAFRSCMLCMCLYDSLRIFLFLALVDSTSLSLYRQDTGCPGGGRCGSHKHGSAARLGHDVLSWPLRRLCEA